MATRIVTRVVDDSGAVDHQRHARVMFDSEREEYQVKQYRHAELVGTYHTDSKVDAIGTAKVWVFKGL